MILTIYIQLKLFHKSEIYNKGVEQRAETHEFWEKSEQESALRTKVRKERICRGRSEPEVD